VVKLLFSANGQHSYYVEIRGLKNKKAPWYDVNGSQLLASEQIQITYQGDYTMNSTQNQKITQITSATLIIGVDIRLNEGMWERRFCETWEG
jgi:hypothetical protein